MREEFYAGLEDRKYLTLPDAQKKGLQVRAAWPGWGLGAKEGGKQGHVRQQRSCRA